MARSARCLQKLAVLSAFFTLPLSALADGQLDRFEALSERSNAIMMDIMVREYVAMGADADALRAATPDVKWDGAYRAAGQCVLDSYREIIGSSGVNDMLDEMEKFVESLDGDASTLDDLAELGETDWVKGVSTDQQIAISQECGTIELDRQRMRDSGLTDVLNEIFSSLEETEQE